MDHDVWTRAASPAALALTFALGLAALPAPVAAQAPAPAAPAPQAAAPAPDPVADLRAQLEALKAEYERRIAELEKRLTELKAAQGQAPAPSAPPATATAEATPPPAPAPAPEAVPSQPAAPEGSAVPSQTSNYFNPSVSVIGNFLAVGGQNRTENLPSAELRESELGIQAIVDPYARADFFISFGEQGVAVEEGFVTFTALP
jgi:hypothetical protein